MSVMSLFHGGHRLNWSQAQTGLICAMRLRCKGGILRAESWIGKAKQLWLSQSVGSSFGDSTDHVLETGQKRQPTQTAWHAGKEYNSVVEGIVGMSRGLDLAHDISS